MLTNPIYYCDMSLVRVKRFRYFVTRSVYDIGLLTVDNSIYSRLNTQTIEIFYKYSRTRFCIAEEVHYFVRRSQIRR